MRTADQMKPPEYFYPLYKSWERNTHTFLVKLAKNYDGVEVETDQSTTDLFFKNLIKSQKAKNWKPFLKMIVNQLRKRKLDLFKLNKKAESLEYNKGIEKWAIFTQDKRLCLMVDKSVVKKVHYIGTKKQLVEFIIRYTLAQLLQDWRGPKMMLLVNSLKSDKIRISSLNNSLGKWDFTGIFTNPVA